jgi:hypothetical protein
MPGRFPPPPIPSWAAGDMSGGSAAITATGTASPTINANPASIAFVFMTFLPFVGSYRRRQLLSGLLGSQRRASV